MEQVKSEASRDHYRNISQTTSTGWLQTEVELRKGELRASRTLHTQVACRASRERGTSREDYSLPPMAP